MNTTHCNCKLAIALLTVLLVVRTTSTAAIVFTEDFENGLTRWTGQTGGVHHGKTVPDPKGSGRGQVLTFKALASGGDMRSTNEVSVRGIYTVSFDYLGTPSPEGAVGDLGGYIGIATNLSLPLFRYVAGTRSTAGPIIQLTDDNAWHSYSVTLTNFVSQPIHLVLLDFSGSQGVPGDVFFDNISVETVSGGGASSDIAAYAGVTIAGTVGAIYDIQISSTVHGNWTTLTNIVLPQSPFLFFDTKSMGVGNRRFYRAIPGN